MKKILFSLFLAILLCCAVVIAQGFVHDTILEGDTQVVDLGGVKYTITLLVVADTTEKSIFEINGKRTKAIATNEGFTFLDGSKIIVGEVLIEEGRDGKDWVEYYFYGAAGEQSIGEDYIIGEPSHEDEEAPQADNVYYETLYPAVQKQEAITQAKTQIAQAQEEEKIAQEPQLEQPTQKKGFFARILSWFLDIFR